VASGRRAGTTAAAMESESGEGPKRWKAFQELCFLIRWLVLSGVSVQWG
jgi:hypothetical protein